MIELERVSRSEIDEEADDEEEEEDESDDDSVLSFLCFVVLFVGIAIVRTANFPVLLPRANSL